MAIVVFRLETQQGYTAYAINCDRAIDAVVESYSTLEETMPKTIKKLIDSFLFSLRHGPIQGMFKAKGIQPMECQGLDKNSTTVAHLAQLYFAVMQDKAKDSDGNMIPVDISSQYAPTFLTGIIERMPEFDGASYELPELEAAAE